MPMGESASCKVLTHEESKDFLHASLTFAKYSFLRSVVLCSKSLISLIRQQSQPLLIRAAVL